MVKRTMMLLVFGVVAAACSSMSVRTDFDRTVKFGKYSTFDFYAGPQGMNQLMLKRVRRAVASELRAKGLRRPISARADLMVEIRMRQHSEPRANSVSVGYGSWWGWGGGISTSQVSRVPVGSLVIDLVDGRTNELVWRGVAEGVLGKDPQRRAERIYKAVREMFSGFPPGRR